MGQRRDAYGRARIVREDQERTAVRDHTAVERHAIQGGAHCVFTHAEVHVAAGWIIGLEIRGALELRVVGWRQIGGAAHQLRKHAGDGDRTLPDATRVAMPFSSAGKTEALLPAFGNSRLRRRLRSAAELRIRRRQMLQASRSMPLRQPCPPRRRGERTRPRQQERGNAVRPATQASPWRRELLIAQRLTMSLGRVLLIRCAKTDVSAAGDQ